MRAFLVGLVAVAGVVHAQAVEQVVAPAPSPTRRFEVALLPVAVQLNTAYTQHLGTFASVSWFPHDRVSLQLFGGGNWDARPGTFAQSLTGFRVESVSKTLLMRWGVFGGVELEPVVGAFTVFGSTPVRFGLVLGAGAGAGGTAHQLRQGVADTGVRFMGTFEVGLRAQLGERLTLRLGVRDFVYSSRVSAVNGCDDPTDPFTLIDGAPASRCSLDVAAEDTPAAIALLRAPNAELLHTVQLALGLGVRF